MKPNLKYYIEALFVFCIMVFLNPKLLSQGTDSRSSGGSQKKMYIGLSIEPISSKISNEGFSGNLTLKKGSSVNIKADAGFFFSDLIGISIGAGLSSFSTTFSIDSSSYKFMTTDSEDEAFEMRVKGRSIKEDQKISLLSIPVCLNLRIKAGEKLGLFLKPGFSFNIPLTKKYDGEGVFTYEAYYAQYPILLTDLPDFGLASNYNTSVSDELEIKPVLALTVSGGVTYSVNENIVFLAGITMNKSAGNISGFEKDNEYRISRSMDELRSIMAGSTSSGLQSFGLSVGLRYFIK